MLRSLLISGARASSRGRTESTSLKAGVIHQEFEKTWLENPNREPQEQVHCMGLHLGNFKELVPKMFIPGDPNPNDVAEFCTAVAQILSDFPSDEMQLVNALEANKLRGFRFSSHPS
jgi:hypothetical protein